VDVTSSRVGDLPMKGDGVGADELPRLLRELREPFAAILGAFRIPAQDCEDVLQTVVLHYLHKRERIRCPEAWFRGALRNQCRMYWRSRQRAFVAAVDSGLLEVFAGSDQGDQERAVLRRNLARWIADLDWRCRSLLRLRYYLGYETREVASEMGYQPASVDKVTRRCLDVLGRKLAVALPARRAADTGRSADG